MATFFPNNETQSARVPKISGIIASLFLTFEPILNYKLEEVTPHRRQVVIPPSGK